MSDVVDWWCILIIDMESGWIELCGYLIEELIGNVSFFEMIWFMVCGDCLFEG